MLCTALDPEERIAPFSTAKYMIVYDENLKEFAVQAANPVLKRKRKRNAFAWECIKLNANRILVPRGSLSFSGFLMLKRSGVEVLVAKPGEKFSDAVNRKAEFSDVLVSLGSATREWFSSAVRR
ncbi:MAG: hypothetical protein ACYDAZ_03945 [Thermoplasmataceae archaeon]|nr:hypothetical protein [Candidatus Thermoplasmatota archaeon]